MGEITPENRIDIELMLRMQIGDLEAFEQLFKKFEKPIYNFFVRLGSDRTHAEDLLQDTFLRLWKSSASYFPQGKFSTYLFQIAKNVFFSYIDKKKRQRELSLDYGDSEAGAEFLFEAEESSPTASMEQEELAKIILNAIEKLDEKHRMVFVLAHYQDLKYAEIAEVLDIPLGTVKTRMMHAERKLREILRPFFPSEENDE